MRVKTIERQFDFVVCGGGMSGICAAIQAARSGLKTALINNRGVLGGNASPEIRVHVCGATGASQFNLYSREGGIIGELLIENRHRNPQGNVYLWHTVLLDAVKREPNCTLFLNTNIDNVNMDNERIISVEGSQLGSEKRYVISGDYFLDDTGDGTIGYLAGADYMYGREAKSKWGENIAPDEEDKGVLLSSLSFYSKDFHRKMGFELPEFTKDMREAFEKSLEYREIPDRIPNDPRYDGYRFQWYYEIGGGKHQIFDNEEIIEEHNKLMFHIWDYIKNKSEYESDQFDLEYVSPVLGKRESRRLVGEYILKESDIANQTDFEDAIAYGGWSIDLHAKGGFFDNDLINRHYYLRGIYQIPLRCCCVKKVSNLMVASRCLSVSHVASGTTRIMSTLALLGQGCALAAVLAKKYGVTPNIVAEQYIKELQQLLQRYDQGIVGIQKKNEVMEQANVTVTSSFKGQLQHTKQFIPLKSTIGFSMPVEKNSTTITFYMKADQDTELQYKIYKATKKENYGPEVLLREEVKEIKGNAECQEIQMDISGLDYEGSLFIEFEQNDNIEVEYTTDRLNGFQLLERKKSPRDTYYDIYSCEPLVYLWDRFPGLFVFHCETSVYSGENIKNGFIRNYGLPNLWISSEEDQTPEITISLAKPTTLSTVSTTFDNLCDDIDYDTLETVYESNVWEEVVKDYDLYEVIDGKEVLLKSIRDNYQRMNQISIPEKEYTCIKIKLLKTNGARRFGVYDVDLY